MCGTCREVLSVPAVYASVVWSRKCFMFCSLWTWRQFCFCVKTFWYSHLQFVLLTGNQHFVSSWISCVHFAGLTIQFCLESKKLIFRWIFSLDIGDKIFNCHHWDLNLQCSSTCELHLLGYPSVQSFSQRIIIADWTFIFCVWISRDCYSEDQVGLVTSVLPRSDKFEL